MKNIRNILLLSLGLLVTAGQVTQPKGGYIGGGLNIVGSVAAFYSARIALSYAAHSTVANMRTYFRENTFNDQFKVKEQDRLKDLKLYEKLRNDLKKNISWLDPFAYAKANIYDTIDMYVDNALTYPNPSSIVGIMNAARKDVMGGWFSYGWLGYFNVLNCFWNEVLQLYAELSAAIAIKKLNSEKQHNEILESLNNISKELASKKP